MKFSVSVIIPVYNGERFIEKAIYSVLQQPEVSEVLVINDGSTDNTTNVVSNIQLKDSRVLSHHHINRVNKGRSATRNLGIKNAKNDFIAFLDADDYYLENRFVNDKKKFEDGDKIDGVYNAVGYHFYRNSTQKERKELKLDTVRQIVKPEDLFDALIYGKYGHFHINGLTVKKSIFNTTGFFNEKLMVGEDTDLFWKMALKCTLVTGIISYPLAKRGVHDFNVFNRKDLYSIYNIKIYESLIFWSNENSVSLKKIDILLEWFWLFRFKENNILIKDIACWGHIFFKNIRLLLSVLSIKYFPLVRLRQKLFPFFYSYKN